MTSSKQYQRFSSALANMIREGRSFSGRERNCCFLNVAGGQFADVSSVVKFNFPDDSRALATTDWDYDGDLDVWLTNRNSPRIRFLRNDSGSGHHFLAVRLQGTQANRDAIGSRVEVVLAGTPPRKLIRSLYAGHGFLAQSSKWLHFGLGDASRVERLIVRWPGGERQEYHDLHVDNFYLLTEGEAEAALHRPPDAVPDLGPTQLAALPPSGRVRVALVGRTPLPQLRYRTWNHQHAVLQFPRERTLLINLWANWCSPCLAELKQLVARQQELKAAKLDVAVFTLDGVQNQRSQQLHNARQFLQSINSPFASGIVSVAMLDKLGLFQLPFVQPGRIDALPTSLLVSADGLVQAIYKGPLDVDALLRDAQQVQSAGSRPADLAASFFPGRWHRRPAEPLRDQLITLGAHFMTRGYFREAAVYYQQALQLDPDSKLAKRNLEEARSELSKLAELAEQFTGEIEGKPNAVAHYNLALVLRKQHQIESAIQQYLRALQLDPDFSTAHLNLGTLLAEEGDLDGSTEHFREALRIDPENRKARENLKRIEAARRER